VEELSKVNTPVSSNILHLLAWISTDNYSPKSGEV